MELRRLYDRLRRRIATRGGDEPEGDTDLPARHAISRIAPDGTQLQCLRLAVAEEVQSHGVPAAFLHYFGEFRRSGQMLAVGGDDHIAFLQTGVLGGQAA